MQFQRTLDQVPDEAGKVSFTTPSRPILKKHWASAASSISSPGTPLLSPSESAGSYNSLPTTPDAEQSRQYLQLHTPSTSPERILGAAFAAEPRKHQHEFKPMLPLTPPRETSPIRNKPISQPPGFQYIDSTKRNFDWDVYSADPKYSSELSLTRAGRQCFKRRMGPTEVSYYLGSRGEGVESGVNDMYLHVGFKARSPLMQPERVLDVWTEIVSRHALLASTVEYTDVNNVKFRYEHPKNMRLKAKSLLSLRAGQDQKQLLDSYLNGPRTLSDERLAYLIMSTPDASFVDEDPAAEQEYDMLLLCTHFLGDGMALHTTANELFTLLADQAPADGADTIVSSTKNIEMIKQEQSWSSSSSSDSTSESEVDAFEIEELAQAMETKIVTPEKWQRLAWAAARVEYSNEQNRQIGGQAFARQKRGERKTLVPTVSWSAAETKMIIGKCKANKSTISHAMFALSNIAHIRSSPAVDATLPTMLYSALNLRPYLKKSGDWYHIAIGYYNIILPSFMPSALSSTAAFWHRAASVRAQTSKVVKSKFLAGRSQLMALEREQRAIGFEIEDERRRQEKLRASVALSDKMVGLGFNPVSSTKLAPAAIIVPKKQDSTQAAPKKAPNTALMGLSMLGNLDGMYSHKDYHGLQLHTLTTGSRQRPGALLLFAYTFAGKLWLSLGYDSMGFKQGVIESWWSEMLKGVDEFLLA